MPENNGERNTTLFIYRLSHIKAWLFVALATAILEAVTRAGVFSDYLPAPTTIIRSFVVELSTGELTQHVGATLLAYFGGLALGVIIGITLGLLMGLSKTFYAGIRVVVELLRPIPSVAIIPLAILIFGLGTYAMRVALICYAALWPILLNTLYGVQSIDPLVVDTARNFRLSRHQIWYRVILPSALPNIATGLRLSVGTAVQLTIATEFVAGTSGIGYYVGQKEQLGQLPEMYSGIILAGLLGYASNVLFRMLERRLIFWHPAVRNIT